MIRHLSKASLIFVLTFGSCGPVPNRSLATDSGSAAADPTDTAYWNRFASQNAASTTTLPSIGEGTSTPSSSSPFPLQQEPLQPDLGFSHLAEAAAQKAQQCQDQQIARILAALAQLDQQEAAQQEQQKQKQLILALVGNQIARDCQRAVTDPQVIAKKKKKKKKHPPQPPVDPAIEAAQCRAQGDQLFGQIFAQMDRALPQQDERTQAQNLFATAFVQVAACRNETAGGPSPFSP